jgi:hypothetical protein
MDKPIYQFFVANNNVAANLAWKALPEAEQKALNEKQTASLKAVAAKPVVVCNSAWSDESHPWWGVLRFPNLQARMEHTRTLQKIGWLDIIDAFTLLGTSENEPAELTIPNPIYKLWIIVNNPATAMTAHLPQGLDTLKWDKHDALYKEHGSQVVLGCASGWCNEAYPFFGLSAYPDVEANLKIQAGLNELGWPGQLQCVSYLGTPME